MKFRTHGNRNLSKAIQDKLFELGYQWSLFGREHAFVWTPFIYAKDDGSLLYGYSSGTFTTDPLQETTIEELFNMQPRETIVIDGKKYDKEEVKKALVHLDSIEW